MGSGLVSPALASTAVGVVRPRQAGMASGINTTFRQVGIATGIAVFGTLFTGARRAGAQVVAAAFVHGLNEIVVVGGAGALLAAAAAVALIRGKDFVARVPAPATRPDQAGQSSCDAGAAPGAGQAADETAPARGPAPVPDQTI